MKTIGTLHMDGNTLVLTLADPIPGLPGRFTSVGLDTTPGRQLGQQLANIGNRIGTRLNNELLEFPNNLADVNQAVLMGQLILDDPECQTDPIIASTLSCVGQVVATVADKGEELPEGYFTSAWTHLRAQLFSAAARGLTPEQRAKEAQTQLDAVRSLLDFINQIR